MTRGTGASTTTLDPRDGAQCALRTKRDADLGRQLESLVGRTLPASTTSALRTPRLEQSRHGATAMTRWR
ncbi:MAG TPA: hypothetical protein VIL34_12195 [Actinopolymorphaceae bacterium]